MAKAGGVLLFTTPEGRTREYATVTCGHCNSVVRIPHREEGIDPETVLAHCHACDQDICIDCHKLQRCIPIERWCELVEWRDRWMKEYEKARR